MIIRTHKQPFEMIVIHKYAILQDDRLSLKAKGLLTYLLGHADGWETRIEEIIKHCKDGRESVMSALKELQTYGYALKTQIRNAKGQIVDVHWEINELPKIYKQQPKSGKPKSGNPTSGKQGLTATKSKSCNEKTEVGKTEVGKTEVGKPDPNNIKINNNKPSNKITSSPSPLQTANTGKSEEDEEGQKYIVSSEGKPTKAVRYLAEIFDCLPETLLHTLQARQVSLAEGWQAGIHALKNRKSESNPKGLAQPLAWLKKAGIFDTQGRFIHRNGLGSLDIPNLMSWVDGLPGAEKDALLNKLASLPAWQMSESPAQKWSQVAVLREVEKAHKRSKSHA